MRKQSVGLVVSLAFAVGLSACSSPPKGYGVSTRNLPPAATMIADPAQADTTTTAEKTRDTYLDLIRQMQTQGLWFASLAHIDAFELSYGTSPDAQLMRADALRNAGKMDEAIAIYKQMTNGPQAARAYRGLGLAAGARQDFSGAAQFFAQAQRRNPTDASILSDLAYAHMRAGQLEAAWVPIMQAAQLTPRDPRVQSNLALFYYAQGDSARAEQVLNAMANADDSTRDALRRTAQQIRARSGGAERPSDIGRSGTGSSNAIRPVTAAENGLPTSHATGALLVRRTVGASPSALQLTSEMPATQAVPRAQSLAGNATLGPVNSAEESTP